MVMIDIGNPKLAREILTAVQSQVKITQMPKAEATSGYLQMLIDQIDLKNEESIPEGWCGDTVIHPAHEWTLTVYAGGFGGTVQQRCLGVKKSYYQRSFDAD